jgi:multiple sugar transport system substrate-binding protein
LGGILFREISRRALLKRGAAAGLAAAGMPLLARAPGVRAQGSRALEFTAWEFQPDTIQRFLDEWSAGSGVDVNLGLIPNVGYGPAIQTRLQGGATIDIYYNFTYNSGRFVDLGLARDISDLPGVDDMLADMFPPARARHALPDGRVVSAPYFSAAHVLHYNQRHLEEHGITEPPQTLQEQYDQAKLLKDAGIPSPYVAYWIKEFCEEYLMVYLLAEGIEPFDDEGNPVFADDPRSRDVFEWWAAMFQDRLTTETMLTDDPIKLAQLMGSGDASFYVLHHYFLKIIRDLEDAPAKDDVTIHYRIPGAKGDTLQMGEVIQMGTQTGDMTDAAWDLMRFYGWKDESGELRTFKAWADAAALACPYPAFFEDAEVQAAYGDYYDMAALSSVFEAGSSVVSARALPWYQPFQVKVGERIHALLLGQASAADTVTGLADDVRSVQAGGI